VRLDGLAPLPAEAPANLLIAPLWEFILGVHHGAIESAHACVPRAAMTEARPALASGRSIAVAAAGILLVIMAIPYALCAVLFAAQGWNPRGRIAIGGVLLPSFGYEAMVVFLALLLLSGYAGLAAIRRWRGWQLLAAAAAWAMMGLSAAIAWFLLNGFLTGLPGFGPAIGAAMALFVLLAGGALTANEPGGAYFVRHWQGQLKLSESYWRNGLGGGLLLAMVEYIVAVPILTGADFRRLPAMLICIMLANAAFLMWVGVGVWRSANRHRDNRIWAILAQATVVLGGASFVLRSALLLAAMTGLLGRA
jgi:hypothetical protein